MAFRKKGTENDQPENGDNSEKSDDTFGLPEIEYEPLKRGETPQPEVQATSAPEPDSNVRYQREEVQTEYTFEDDDEPSAWPKILGILAILALAGGAFWYFAKYQPARKAEEEAKRLREAREKVVNDSLANVQRLADERALAERRRADSLANLSGNVGTIETLNERTRRYYVVIASAVDGDLIMDEAKRLSAKGVNAKIIPPFGKAKFYRLSVADGDTYASTQSTADGMKAQYGDAVWVIKY